MDSGSKLPSGSAALTFVDDVIHLDPEVAVFDAMVNGWIAQMASRGLKAETIDSRMGLVRRFARYADDEERFCRCSIGLSKRLRNTLRADWSLSW